MSVTRATKASTLSLHALDAPGASAERQAKIKRSKYAAICSLNGYENMPFVLETHGALCRSGQALLKRLAGHSADLSPEAFMRHAHGRLSVALQNGNAFVQLDAVQSFLQQELRGGVRQQRLAVNQTRMRDYMQLSAIAHARADISASRHPRRASAHSHTSAGTRTAADSDAESESDSTPPVSFDSSRTLARSDVQVSLRGVSLSFVPSIAALQSAAPQQPTRSFSAPLQPCRMDATPGAAAADSNSDSDSDRGSFSARQPRADDEHEPDSRSHAHTGTHAHSAVDIAIGGA